MASQPVTQRSYLPPHQPDIRRLVHTSLRRRLRRMKVLDLRTQVVANRTIGIDIITGRRAANQVEVTETATIVHGEMSKSRRNVPRLCSECYVFAEGEAPSTRQSCGLDCLNLVYPVEKTWLIF
jgi:hypothetical protein